MWYSDKDHTATPGLRSLSKSNQQQRKPKRKPPLKIGKHSPERVLSQGVGGEATTEGSFFFWVLVRERVSPVHPVQCTYVGTCTACTASCSGRVIKLFKTGASQRGTQHTAAGIHDGTMVVH